MKTQIQKLLLALLLGNATLAAYAQSTAFTYNGRLNEIGGGGAVNGNFEFSFSIYEVAANGVPVAGPLIVTPVAVANGLFTAVVDFGPGIFTGPPRFLAISVRPVGGGDFQLLTPRQELTSSPYAIHAASAGTAASVADGAVVKSLNNLHDHLTLAAGANVTITPNGNTLTLAAAGVGGSGIWSVNGNNAYFNAGNVGLGTSTPAHRLSLSGGPSWTANGWLGALELPNIAAIGWRANAAGQRFGMGHTATGFYMFRTASDPGTIGSPAIYDFTINDLGSVGIGTTTPSGRLQVAGGWDGEQGALQLSGHRPTIRFTGDADSGNESWLLHLGGAGPGNLGFFRRTGPAAWSPVMQLTTSGRQMEIYGQDALGLIGFQPFLTLFDTSSGNVASRIQAANGDLILETASYIAGQSDTGLVLKNGSGNVGIGTTTPTAKLQSETSQTFKHAIYGKAAGLGASGVYGQSSQGPAVYGLATDGGPGVYGRSTGAAVYAEGNAAQSRDKGGFVKAMAHIDPFLPASQYVVRCYNSHPGATTTTAPCGITVTRPFPGVYFIDFGFKVDDRFVSLTSRTSSTGAVGINGTIGQAVGNQVRVDIEGAGFYDSAFDIIVY